MWEGGSTWSENRYPGCACEIPSHRGRDNHLRDGLLICRFVLASELVALHPGSRSHWFHAIRTTSAGRTGSIYIYLTGNRFQYLGNGFSTREGPSKGTTWYFDAPEEGFDSISYPLILE